LDANTYAVTVFACEGPHNIQDHSNSTAKGLLLTVTGAMSQAGSNNVAAQGHPLLALGPEHAALLEAGGFGRTDIQRFIYEQARFPAHRLSSEYVAARSPVDGRLVIADSPDTIAVMVLGGPGKHSAWMPTFGRASAPSTVCWKPAPSQPRAP
jgi:hypothetical protein